jgi:hypothetical protein
VTDEVSTARPPAGAHVEAPLPLGLWVVAALLVAGGVAFALGAFGAGPSFLADGLIGLQNSAQGQIVLGILAAAMILAAIGIVLRVRAAWGLTMLIVLIGLVANLAAYFGGDPNYLRLALFVVTAFYLNQRVVREVFLGPRQGVVEA